MPRDFVSEAEIDNQIQPESARIVALRRARAFIARPDRWCQGALFRDGRGYPTGDSDSLYRIKVPSGTKSMCLQGAIFVSGMHPIDFMHFSRIFLMQFGENIPSYNDTHSHAEVLAALDKVIDIEKWSETKQREGRRPWVRVELST